MKRIVIAQYSLGGGGAEKVLVDILNNIDYSKYKIDLFLLRKEGVYLDKINKNVNVITVFNRIKFKNPRVEDKLNLVRFLLVKYFSKLVNIIYIGKKYDVEIAFVEGLTSKFIADGINKNSKKIAWVHIDLAKYKPIKEFFQKRFYPKFNKIACVSNESERVIKTLYPNLKDKTQVVYNLIDSKEIINLAKENNNYECDLPVVLGIGRLSPQKRFDVLIKAHKILIDRGVNHKLLILGEGDKRKELEELIVKLDVQKTVDLHGFVKNPYSYVNKSKVFVMSSDFEGLPLVLCESLVLGKPIVSTRCTGPTELLEDGMYGLIAECGNEKEIADGIEKLLTNEELYNYYSLKSLERSKIFNVDKALEEIYSLID